MVFLWKTIQAFYFLKEVIGDLLCSVVFFSGLTVDSHLLQSQHPFAVGGTCLHPLY